MRKMAPGFVLAVFYDGCNMIQEVRLHKRVINLTDEANLVWGSCFVMVLQKSELCLVFLSLPEWKLRVEDEVAGCFG